MNDTYKIINVADINNNQIVPVLEDRGINFKLDHRRYGHAKEYLCYTLTDLEMQVNGDLVTPQLRVYTANDGTAAFRIMLGCIRFVCWNGLSAGDFLYSQRVVHRVGPTADSKLAEISNRIDGALDYLTNDFNAELNEVSGVPLTDEQAIQVIGSLPVSDSVKRRAIWCHFNPRRSADALQKNLWGVWNNVNEALREKSKGFTAVSKNDSLLTDITALAGDATRAAA